MSNLFEFMRSCYFPNFLTIVLTILTIYFGFESLRLTIVNDKLEGKIKELNSKIGELLREFKIIHN